MLRAVLTFLIGLPMLMPPGMCLCEYLPCPDDANSASSQFKLPAGQDLGPETHRCDCGRRRQRAEVGATGVSIDTELTSLVPSPQPEKHHPGCPALDKNESRIVVRAETVVLPPAIVAVTVFVAEDDHAVIGCDERKIAAPSSPLVISHGPLLI